MQTHICICVPVVYAHAHLHPPPHLWVNGRVYGVEMLDPIGPRVWGGVRDIVAADSSHLPPHSRWFGAASMHFSENRKNSRSTMVGEWTGPQGADAGPDWSQGVGGCGVHCSHISTPSAPAFQVFCGGTIHFTENR